MRVRAAALVLLFGLGACTAQKMDIAPSHPERFASWTDSDYLYRFGAGDRINLHFIVYPDLDSQILIGPDGRALYPLIGAVMTDGLTAAELKKTLTAAYAPVLRRPDLDVTVLDYAAAKVFVGGEVRTPGVQPLTGRMNAAQAIMAAGGFQDTARTSEVVVVRRHAGDHKPIMRTVDIKNLLAQGLAEADFPLFPGDLVFVPKSDIADIDLFVQQYITNTLPFARSYNYNYGTGTNP